MAWDRTTRRAKQPAGDLTAHEVFGSGWETPAAKAALAPADVAAVLDDLGIPYKPGGGELATLCPYHPDLLGREDSSIGSFKINEMTGLNRCYSCGGGGSFVTFLVRARNMDWEAATTLVLSRGGATVQRKRGGSIKVKATVTEAHLALFDPPPMDEPEVLRRHCTAEALERYGVLWDTDQGAWILPVRRSGALYGWQIKHPTQGVWGHPRKLPLGDNFFGWDVREDETQAVVVESPLDAVRMHSAGIPNVVASWGSTIALDQTRLLLGCDRVVLALDNDVPGRRSMFQAAHGVRGNKPLACGPLLGRVHLLVATNYPVRDPAPKDPGDMTDAECHALVASAVSAAALPREDAR